MMTRKLNASTGSIAVGENNTGDLFAVNAGDNANVVVHVQQRRTRELPSILSSLVVFVAGQDLSTYGQELDAHVAAEIVDKLHHNNLSVRHFLISDYLQYVAVLEQCYRGVEQENSDARRLVRRRVSRAYNTQLEKHLAINHLKATAASAFVREHASVLIRSVIDHLLDEYATSEEVKVDVESAELAVSLIVVDTAMECAILERPSHAAAS